MSQIAIKGATTGTGVFTLESPATNTDRTLILPDEAGTVLTSAGVPASAMPAGSVLQVVSTTKTDVSTTTSTTYVDVSGLSVSITPISTSSKILVIANISFGSTDDGGVQVLRGSTPIALGTTGTAMNSLGQSAAASATFIQSTSISHLDSPSTTSATTYKVQFRNHSGGVIYINRRASNASFDAASTITVMEIAG